MTNNDRNLLMAIALILFCCTIALVRVCNECRATTSAVKALHRHFHEKSKERGA